MQVFHKKTSNDMKIIYENSRMMKRASKDLLINIGKRAMSIYDYENKKANERLKSAFNRMHPGEKYEYVLNDIYFGKIVLGKRTYAFSSETNIKEKTIIITIDNFYTEVSTRVITEYKARKDIKAIADKEKNRRFDEANGLFK